MPTIAPEVVSKFNRKLVTISMVAATVEASLTNAVIDVYKTDFKFKIVSITHGNRSIVGTVTFNLYNVTDSALVIPAATPVTGDSAVINTFSSVAQTTIDKNDKIQLRLTTAAASTATNLNVRLLVEVLDSPTNAVNEA